MGESLCAGQPLHGLSLTALWGLMQACSGWVELCGFIVQHSQQLSLGVRGLITLFKSFNVLWDAKAHSGQCAKDAEQQKCQCAVT